MVRTRRVENERTERSCRVGPLCFMLLDVVMLFVIASRAAGEVLHVPIEKFNVDLRSAGGSFVKFYVCAPPCCVASAPPLMLCSCVLHLAVQAPWCSHCKKLAPAWQLLSERDLGGVRIVKVDLTRSGADELKVRFAIRAFPTLLFFPPGDTDDIYRYSGKRELEPLTAYAGGGWKETDLFDPSKEPPPPPRKSTSEQLWSLVERNRLPFGFLGIAMVIGIIARVAIDYCGGSKKPVRHISALPRSRPAASAGSPDRSFGNVPLSMQTPGDAGSSASPDRSFGNVPLFQQKPHAE